MLRKRSRSFQKDQKMGVSEPHFLTDVLNKKHDYTSILKVPGLFVGFNTKYSESDSVRSPTSPLDFRIFSSRGNSFRHPRSENDTHLKSLDCGKVGLRLVDSLDRGNKPSGASSSMFYDNKNIFFGRQMTVRGYNFDIQVSTPELPNSLPEYVATLPSSAAKTSEIQKSDSGVVFEIGEVASGTRSTSMLLESKRFRGSDCLYEGMQTPVQSEAGFICSIPASEIELSEDYTCVRKHGPNPKVTHIFGDCIFDLHDHNTMVNSKDHNVIITADMDTKPQLLEPYPFDDFLKVCHACKKKLDGEDVYLYRGEIGFCSNSCRSEAMALDEDVENEEIDFFENPKK